MQAPLTQVLRGGFALVASLVLSAPLHAQQAATDAVQSVAAGRTETVTSRHDDTRFTIVLGSFITAAGTDAAVSMYQIGRGSGREVGFGKWWQDSPVAFAATKSALTAVFAHQLTRLHQKRPKTALVIGIAATAIEAGLIVRGARLAPQVR